MIAAVDQLRDKARGYELSAIAARERDEQGTALALAQVSIVLFELAEALEQEDPD